MSRYTAMLEQTELMLDQRALLQRNRYCTLKQLRIHDQRLFNAINWMQQQHVTEHPRWLKWVLSENDNQLLPCEALTHLATPHDSWLVLHQLKLRLFNTLTPGWQTAMQQQVESCDNSQIWALAHYLQLPLNPFLPGTPVTSAALWYLALSKPNPAHEALQQYCADDDEKWIVQQLAHQLNIEEYQADVSHFSAEQLIKTVASHQFGLMILVSIVDDAMQTKLINYLAKIDQTMAITAMGYSGQLKFAPLLAELAQQQDLNTAAADALTLLCGAMDSDTYVADPALLQHFHRRGCKSSNGRYLCGAPLTEAQVDTVWRSGGGQQRQLASCLRKHFSSPEAVFPADALQVRL